MVPDGCIYGQEVADILGVENVNSVWRIIRRSAARYRKETGKEIVIYQGVDYRARRYVQRTALEAFAEWRKAGPEQAADLESKGYIYGDEIARVLRMNTPKEAWVSIRRNLSRYQRETGDEFEQIYANRRWYAPRTQVEAFCAWYDAFIRGRNIYQQRQLAATRRPNATRKATAARKPVGESKATAPDETTPIAEPATAKNKGGRSITPERRAAFAQKVRLAQQRLEARQRRQARRGWDDVPSREWEPDFA